MPSDLPYMPSTGNVGSILDKIQSAGTPPKFTIDFLKSSLGFTASQDRAFPRVLKQLGFLTPDGTPLPRYNEFKSSTTGGRALAAGLREGWAPIFLADQKANTRSKAELKEMFKTVTGQGESAAQKMASLFHTLAGKADWTAPAEDSATQPPPESVNDHTPASEELIALDLRPPVSLHHDVHVHLPPTSDVSVYRAIFRALREELL